ncbi:MAG: TatD family hydrolase [Candidatus Nealsonbacteria bacterium]
MIIDTHAHLNFNAYKDDVDEVIKNCLENDVWMINVGSQYNTSKRAIELAEKYPKGVYATIGLHPIHLETGLVKIKDDPEEIQFKATEEDFDADKYRELAKSKKVIAIGEAGLDYYWKPKTTGRKKEFKEKQKNILFKQLDLAKELDLPVILHCRMAHEEMIDSLKEYGKVKGVIHCFTGNLDQAKEYIKIGLHLGLNGIIFKLNIDEVIKDIPLDNILVETDCPYLTPPQKDGRNEPLYAKYVLEKIAEIKNIKLEEVINKTTENAKQLFRI